MRERSAAVRPTTPPPVPATWQRCVRRAGHDTADLLGGHDRPRCVLALALYLIPAVVVAWQQPPSRPLAEQFQAVGLTIILSTSLFIAGVFLLSLAAAPSRVAADARRSAAGAALASSFRQVVTEMREMEARLEAVQPQGRDMARRFQSSQGRETVPPTDASALRASSGSR